jgi:voltage-gated potassium channel
VELNQRSTYEAAAAQIARLAGHYILCGAGRTGFYIIQEFIYRQTPCVVIDHDPMALVGFQEKINEQRESPLYVEGDATEDEVLEAAGIRQAKGLIIALDDDKDSLFVVLAARSLNPDLRIVSRVNQEINREKLEKAGADKVVSTNFISGMRAASEMLRPEVVQFLDQMVRVHDRAKTIHFTELALAEIKKPELRQLIEASQQQSHDDAPNLRVRDIGKHTGLLVMAIKKAEQSDAEGESFQAQGRYRFAPDGDAVLAGDDILVVIGTQDKLDEARGEQTEVSGDQ